MKKQTERVSRETLTAVLNNGAADLQVPLSELQQKQLLDYVDLLMKWNAVYNLTAVRDALGMMHLHVLDSLAVLNPMAATLAVIQSPRLLDLGAGAGLPGIVLAILKPEWDITLVDAVQKKAAFMTQAISQLKLGNARAVHGRIEQLTLPPVDAVVSRAFSDLDLFVKLSVPHLQASGKLFAMQGKADDRLLPPFSRKTLQALTVPGVNAARHLLTLEH